MTSSQDLIGLQIQTCFQKPNIFWSFVQNVQSQDDELLVMGDGLSCPSYSGAVNLSEYGRLTAQDECRLGAAMSHWIQAHLLRGLSSCSRTLEHRCC